MSFWTVVLSTLPLVLFVILDARSGLKEGLYSSIISTALLGIFLFFYLDYFDYEIVLTLVSVVFFGALALKKDDKRLFRLSPAVTSLALVVLMVGYRIADKSIIVNLTGKLLSKMGEDQPPEAMALFTNTELLLQFELGMIAGILVHGLYVGYFAWLGSNRSWLIAKLSGYIVVPMIAVAVTAVL